MIVADARALGIRERLASQNPTVVELQVYLARSHQNIGNVESNRGNPDRALEAFEKALAIRERLAREHPDVPDHASVLGATLNNMAAIDGAAKRFAQSAEKLRQAVTRQRKALAANPMNPRYRQFMRNHLTGLVMTANVTQ